MNPGLRRSFYAKVRIIICERLATCLCCIDKSASTDSRESQKSSDPEGAVLDEGFSNHVEADGTRTAALSDPVLVDIRKLLQMKAKQEEDDRARAKGQSRIKRQWMIAAIVVNRLCFIVFTVTLVAVTMAFFFVFHLHH